MAELGIGILIMPQKPWPTVADELREYRTIYREVNAAEPPPTVVAGWTFCDEDERRAREMAERYVGAYFSTEQRHYELGADHFARTKGYEHYAKTAATRQETGAEPFVNLHVWGTPEQCFRKIMEIREYVGCETFVGVFSYARMPHDAAERSMRLFASKVMPELKRV